MKLKRGVWFAGELPIHRMVELSREAERAGLDSIWMAEGYYGRDAFSSLAAIAMATSRVELATGVVNPYTRHPALLAMSFATLDELSNGRAVLGIGSGAKHQLEGEMGYDLSKPLTGVAEAIEIIQQMMVGDLVNYVGKVFQVRQGRLAFRPQRPRLPLYIAAVGPRMCRLAGRVADGVYFAQTSPLYAREAINWVRDGAAEAGRDPDAVAMSAEIIMSVADRAQDAKDAVRPLLGILMTAPESELMLEKNDLDPGIAASLREALSRGGVRAVAAAVPDEVLSVLTIAGAPDDCRERLHELVASGINYPTVSLVGKTAEATLEVIAGFRG